MDDKLLDLLDMALAERFQLAYSTMRESYPQSERLAQELLELSASIQNSAEITQHTKNRIDNYLTENSDMEVTFQKHLYIQGAKDYLYRFNREYNLLLLCKSEGNCLNASRSCKRKPKGNNGQDANGTNYNHRLLKLGHSRHRLHPDTYRNRLPGADMEHQQRQPAGRFDAERHHRRNFRHTCKGGHLLLYSKGCKRYKPGCNRVPVNYRNITHQS